MSEIKYTAGIDYVKGAWAKPKKKNGHTHGNYLLCKHREAPTTNPNCCTSFLQGKDTYVRTTPLSADEIENRNRFRAVAAAVATRAKDLNKMTTDQQNFIAQKDLAGGKKTMKAYLWSLELVAYDNEHPQG